MAIPTSTFATKARVAALAVTVIACAGAMPGADDMSPDGRVTREYQPLDEPIRNPERGLVQFVEMSDPGDVRFVAGLGVSLANARIRLDEYRDRPIDAAYLAELGAGFNRIRRAGLKLVLRFQYNNGSGKDPSMPQLLSHIKQLEPILAQHGDIIAFMQAGFIGAWGEWHNSISGHRDDASRRAVLEALLAALPAGHAVQVRSPVFKEKTFGGGPLDLDQAFDGTARARIGHHNDCLLSDAADQGTYPPPIEQWKSYLERDSKFVPVGGESCALSPPRTDCDSAVAELARFHWTYLNRSYHPDVIAAWTEQGCMEEIAADLGYRLILRRASWPGQVRPGQTITVQMVIDNVGYAAPFNPRPAYLVIGSGPERQAIALDGVDPRHWWASQSHEVEVSVQVPAHMAPGRHPLALWLPDWAPHLRRRPEYSIRLANRDVWQHVEGQNLLGNIVVK